LLRVRANYEHKQGSTSDHLLVVVQLCILWDPADPWVALQQLALRVSQGCALR
jgi:hypothetical protein